MRLKIKKRQSNQKIINLFFQYLKGNKMNLKEQSKKENLILLNDLLNLEDLDNVRIRFNINDGSGYDPIKLFKEDINELLGGQFWNHSKSYFKVGNIAIGFARVEGDKWLLFDISKITKDLQKFNAVGYEHETIQQYEKYFGRIIVKYHNRSQYPVRYAKDQIKDLEVFEILPEKFNDDDFPGYENVNLSFDDLKRVLERKDWKTALENQKGVYLITDTNTGKLYVGSAYGEKMILGRWATYAKSGYDRNEMENGKYPNKKFQELVIKERMTYIEKYFRYSILDIYKSKTDDKTIINRESHWKNVLKTREFGYNEN